MITDHTPFSCYQIQILITPGQPNVTLRCENQPFVDYFLVGKHGVFHIFLYIYPSVSPSFIKSLLQVARKASAGASATCAGDVAGAGVGVSDVG